MATQPPHSAAARAQNVPATPDEAVARLQKQLKTALPVARAKTAWERVAPGLLPALGLTAVFMGTALSGAWDMIPQDKRPYGLGGFSLALAAALVVPLRRTRFPTRDEAIARIETHTGVPHNPVTTILGKPFHPDGSDGRKLWDLEQQATAAKVGRFKVGPTDLKMREHDPHYVRRALIAFPLGLGLAFGGSAALDNLSQPFDWTVPPVPPAPVVPARIDAWISPPEYTGLAPVFLTDKSVAREETPSGSLQTIPAGTRMTVRVVGGTATVTLNGGATLEKEPDPAPASASEPVRSKTTTPPRPEIREYEILIQDNSAVYIEAYGGSVMGWSFDVTPDTGPIVSLQTTPNPDHPGMIDLQYSVQDDYGAVSIETEITSDETAQSKSRRAPRPLIAPPQFNLPVPRP